LIFLTKIGRLEEGGKGGIIRRMRTMMRREGR